MEVSSVARLQPLITEIVEADQSRNVLDQNVVLYRGVMTALDIFLHKAVVSFKRKAWIHRIFLEERLVSI